LKKMTPLQQYIFDTACFIKQNFQWVGLPTMFLDATIFKKVKEVTGGRLKFAVSGGAPIAQETQILLDTVLCPIVQGYGMTETCGTLTMQGPAELGVSGSVGTPFGCVEIKLVASAGYDPNPVSGPARGEIWARGPNIMQGYYKQPKVTAETISPDGWIMTGDIGEWSFELTQARRRHVGDY
jgi:long-chain acyl-CoA synthetase